MDYLPVEIIGNILSRLGAARYVVIASATSKKWLEARKIYLKTLAFSKKDRVWLNSIETDRQEIIISHTIFQTSMLESLSIIMDDEVSAGSMISWLTYMKDTLRELHYNVKTTPMINILEKCDLQKLEVLSLDRKFVVSIESAYKKFPCLRRISLSRVRIPALDVSLNLLLTACPNIEFLTLHNITPFSKKTVELSSNSLKDINVEGNEFGKFILEADNIEKLQLKDCLFDSFELFGKDTLKYLKIYSVWASKLYFGESAENLEVLDVSHCHYHYEFKWENFNSMFSRLPKLRRLKIWKIDISSVDIERIFACLPPLTHLSLSYEDREISRYNFDDIIDDIKEAVDHELLFTAATAKGGNSLQLQNVVELKLGWTWFISHMFSFWVAIFLGRCPNLRKLVIFGFATATVIHLEGCQRLAKLTSFMVFVMRKHTHVEVEFVYD